MGVTHSRFLGKMEARQRPAGKCSEKHSILYVLKSWASACLGPSRFCLATEGMMLSSLLSTSSFLALLLQGKQATWGVWCWLRGSILIIWEYSERLRTKCEWKTGVSGRVSVIPGFVVRVKEDQSQPVQQTLRTPPLVKAPGTFSQVHPWSPGSGSPGRGRWGITNSRVSKRSRTFTCTSPPCFAIYTL